MALTARAGAPRAGLSPLDKRKAAREVIAATESELSLPDVLGSEIADILEQRITYLVIPPGAHVTEQQVCDEFRISRSPVREAFRQLEANGMVVRLARRGIRVKPLTVEDLDEIYACRTPLEGLAASLAARHANADDLAEMAERLAGMKAAVKAKDVRAFFQHNVGYLTRLHGAAGNAMLLRILAVIEKQAMRYRYLAHMDDPSVLVVVLSGLTELHGHIAAGEAVKAKSALLRTMTEAHKVFRGAVRDYDRAHPE